MCLLPKPGRNLDYGTVFHHHLHPTIPTPSTILIDDQRDHSSKPRDPIPKNYPKRRFPRTYPIHNIRQ
ncbi:uncharacterized protein CLUP02_05701 [Colletotrichum lupini]|uniref:Uncharacterized protein n=1 Tax=Colletotrichum lupini TaxID=145971 RepID=A0A9Q8SMQ3_9PEZI|nr:uncharacterized protein CLUP02_05701 [Colletotrichum lupini]UQC80219.1 hypothetical protein CLUP02_05701 [Colletotrichum lupini]